MKTTTALLSFVLLSSCTSKKVSFETLEDARKIARQNAEENAQEYRQKNPEFASCGIGSAGDSTQSVECPQGDGWATLVLKCAVNGQVSDVSLKCSTVSSAVGCLPALDFKTKPFATEDNRCNSNIPMLKKLSK